LIYSPKADIPAFLNMPNTPKAEILACPFRAYPEWHVYRLGSSGLFRYFYGNSGAKGLM